MLDPETENSLGWVHTIAERRIAEAIEEGRFDDLPGKGKPIVFEDDNPLTPAHLRITHHVLKNAQVVPTWISMEQEIDAAKALAEAFREHCVRHARAGKLLTESQTLVARAEYERLMRAANDLILRFNLVTPFVHRAPIPFRIKDRLAQWDRELAEATGGAAQ